MKRVTFSAGNKLHSRASTTAALPDELGFTLIELLIVMVIAVSIITVAVPQFSRSIDTVRLHQAARESAAFLRLSRNSAVVHSGPVAVEIDAGERQLYVAATGDSYLLPPQISVSFPDEPDHYPDVRRTILFHADGSSTGGRLSLDSDKRSQQITIDWLTGRVSIE